MKIIRRGFSRMTIEDFAEAHDLTMVVGRTDPVVADPARVSAHFEGAEVQDGSFRTFAAGYGPDEPSAIADYAARISGRDMVLDDGREIDVPMLVFA